MDILEKAATSNSPKIILNHLNHIIEFEGESRPEDTKKFYAPVFLWLEEYKKYIYFLANNSHNNIVLNCNFKLEYFNSSSAKSFLDIITFLNEMVRDSKDAKLLINWYYEVIDEDMHETGIEFEKLVGIKFNFIAI